ncbi:MAG: periplasmic heavy metal sensor [Henriciella sp.]|nr:periplasmic heavy metal sensor [Henriciella sp.]
MSEDTKSRLPIWLIVSLMANALLIGLIIGGGLGQRKSGANRSIPGDERALIRGIDEAVPSDQRQTVRRAFRTAFEDSRRERRAVRDVRRKLGSLLSADSYDAAEVQTAFQELRDAESAMKKRMHDVLAEQFGALSEEQRRAIVQDLNRRGTRRGPPGGGRDRRPPPPGPRN